MAKVKVYLHGYFKDFHDGPVEVHADNIAKAVELVTRQLPGFKPNAVHGRHRITVADADYFDLYRPLDREEIHLVPQFNGGKEGGGMQILIGLALVGVGLVIGGPTGGMLLKMGALAALGGIAQLLAPAPEEDDRETQYLGAPKNTVEIGTPIPVLYGRHKVAGHYISYDVDAVDLEEE